MTWLVIIISIVGTLCILFVLGSAYPSPPRSLNGFRDKDIIWPHPMPDLRISEDAPDQIKARIASHNWDMLTPVREAEEKRQKERKLKQQSAERMKKVTQMQVQRLEQEALIRKELYQRYEQQILTIKERRMREGNPVTKKNPIDPDEMPVSPNVFYKCTTG